MATFEPTSPPNNWTFRRVVWATLILVLVALGFWLFSQFYQVVFIVFVAIMIGTVIRPAVTRLYRWGIPRLAGAILVYLLIFVFLIGFMFLLFPLILKQGTTIYAAVPGYYWSLRLWMFNSSNSLVVSLGQFLPQDLFGQVPVQQTGPQILASAGQILGYVTSAAGVIFMSIAVLLLSLHWALEGPRTIQSLLLLIPKEHRESTRELITAMETKVGLFITGQGILCLSIGIAALVVYLIVGLPNALVLALVAGVLEAVPMLGPLLGAVPAALVALSIDPSKLVWVIVGTVIIQQLEGSFLVPWVMDKTVGVNPFVSLLAIFAFGTFLGIGGVLMAIPMAAIIQLLLDRFVFHPGAMESEVSPGRDFASRLRYEAQDLAKDLRKQARHKKEGSDQIVKQTDHVLDEIEAITTDLDVLLSQKGEYFRNTMTKQLVKIGMAIMTTLLALVVLWKFQIVVVYVLISLTLAAALRPMVKAVPSRGFWVRLAWISLYVVALGSFVFLLFLTGQWVIAEIQNLARNVATQEAWKVPGWLEGSYFQQLLVTYLPSPSKIFAAVTGSQGQLVLPGLLGFTQGFSGMVSGIPVILFLTIYWIINQVHFERLWLSLLPSPQRKQARDIWRTIEPDLGAYIRSQVIHGFLVGLLLGLGSWALGSPYPVLLGLAGALACLIPVVGPVLAVVPPLLVGLLTSVQLSLFISLYTILILIVMEAWVKPCLFKRTWDNPVLTLVILIVLANSIGLLGIIIAPPISAVCQIIWSLLVSHRLASGAAAQVSDLKERLERVWDNIRAMDEPPLPLVSSSMARLTSLLEKAEPILQAAPPDGVLATALSEPVHSPQPVTIDGGPSVSAKP